MLKQNEMTILNVIKTGFPDGKVDLGIIVIMINWKYF